MNVARIRSSVCVCMIQITLKNDAMQFISGQLKPREKNDANKNEC